MTPLFFVFFSGLMATVYRCPTSSDREEANLTRRIANLMITRTLRNALIAGVLFFTTLGSSIDTQAHSVQVAYCANCASTLRIFFEHWHGCTVNPTTSGTITISITVGGTTTTIDKLSQQSSFVKIVVIGGYIHV